jgi:hypothetical protein
VAEQVRRHERVSDAKRLKELETGNTRLKTLLAESLLENEVTREAPADSGTCTSRIPVPQGLLLCDGALAFDSRLGDGNVLAD